MAADSGNANNARTIVAMLAATAVFAVVVMHTAHQATRAGSAFGIASKPSASKGVGTIVDCGQGGLPYGCGREGGWGIVGTIDEVAVGTIVRAAFRDSPVGAASTFKAPCLRPAAEAVAGVTGATHVLHARTGASGATVRRAPGVNSRVPVGLPAGSDPNLTQGAPLVHCQVYKGDVGVVTRVTPSSVWIAELDDDCAIVQTTGKELQAMDVLSIEDLPDTAGYGGVGTFDDDDIVEGAVVEVVDWEPRVHFIWWARPPRCRGMRWSGCRVPS